MSEQKYPPPEAELRAQRLEEERLGLSSRNEDYQQRSLEQIDRALRERLSSFIGARITPEILENLRHTGRTLIQQAAVAGGIAMDTEVHVDVDREDPSRINISYEIHRNYTPIRTMGQLEPAGFVRTDTNASHM